VVKELGEESLTSTGLNVLRKSIMATEHLCEVTEKFGGKFHKCGSPAVAKTTELLPMFVCQEHMIYALIAGAKPELLDNKERCSCGRELVIRKVCNVCDRDE
jgi:hypothetical protein